MQLNQKAGMVSKRFMILIESERAFKWGMV